jgi:hypothetical protein
VADRPARLGVISATWRSISYETQEILLAQVSKKFSKRE